MSSEFARQIWGDAIRRLYASKKSKILMGWDGSEWEQRTVANFDSTMNDFLDSIPPHRTSPQCFVGPCSNLSTVRWDPDSPPQGVFFDQSVLLHVTYNYILIAVRAFWMVVDLLRFLARFTVHTSTRRPCFPLPHSPSVPMQHVLSFAQQISGSRNCNEYLYPVSPYVIHCGIWLAPSH
jgi:hypothetical protein